MTSKRLKILIVNRDLSARSRLRENLKDLLYQPQISCCGSFTDAITRLHTGSADLLFIDPPETDLPRFLDQMRQLQRKEQLPAVVVTPSADMQNHSAIAEFLLLGVQGILCVPYSSTQLECLLRNLCEQNPSAKAVKNLSISNKDKGSTSDINKGDALTAAMKQLDEATKKLGAIAPIMKSESFQVILFEKFLRKSSSEKPEICGSSCIHPGDLLKLLVENRGLSYRSISELSGISLDVLAEICSRRKPVTYEIAEALSRTLGESPAYWLSLQKEYQRNFPDQSY